MKTFTKGLLASTLPVAMLTSTIGMAAALPTVATAQEVITEPTLVTNMTRPRALARGKRTLFQTTTRTPFTATVQPETNTAQMGGIVYLPESGGLPTIFDADVGASFVRTLHDVANAGPLGPDATLTLTDASTSTSIAVPAEVADVFAGNSSRARVRLQDKQITLLAARIESGSRSGTVRLVFVGKPDVMDELGFNSPTATLDVDGRTAESRFRDVVFNARVDLDPAALGDEPIQLSAQIYGEGFALVDSSSAYAYLTEEPRAVELDRARATVTRNGQLRYRLEASAAPDTGDIEFGLRVHNGQAVDFLIDETAAAPTQTAAIFAGQVRNQQVGQLLKTQGAAPANAKGAILSDGIVIPFGCEFHFVEVEFNSAFSDDTHVVAGFVAANAKARDLSRDENLLFGDEDYIGVASATEFRYETGDVDFNVAIMAAQGSRDMPEAVNASAWMEFCVEPENFFPFGNERLASPLVQTKRKAFFDVVGSAGVGNIASGGQLQSDGDVFTAGNGGSGSGLESFSQAINALPDRGWVRPRRDQDALERETEIQLRRNLFRRPGPVPIVIPDDNF